MLICKSGFLPEPINLQQKGGMFVNAALITLLITLCFLAGHEQRTDTIKTIPITQLPQTVSIHSESISPAIFVVEKQSYALFHPGP